MNRRKLLVGSAALAAGALPSRVWAQAFSRKKAPAGGLVLRVNTSGSDSNDGITTPLRNIQTAVNMVFFDWDHQGTLPTILVAAGQNFYGPVEMGGIPLGTNLLKIAGEGGQFNIISPTWCFNLSDGSMCWFENINTYGNTGHATDQGIFYLHNYAVADFGYGISLYGDHASTNGIFCDGPCIFTVANGLQMSGRMGAAVKMNRGGAGTVSGVVGPTTGTAPTIDRLFHVRDSASLNLGCSMPGGYASLGASIADDAVIHANGLSIAGGTLAINGGRVS